jgi:hypothetical protein
MLQQKLSLRAKPVILAVTVIMAAVVASGCTTMGRSTADGDVNQSMKTTVVTQVGSKNPVVAGKDRDFWLEMRQKKDLRLARLDQWQPVNLKLQLVLLRSGWQKTLVTLKH